MNGLGMVAASLLITAVVLLLVGLREVSERRDHIRASGEGLAQSLSRIPADRLIPDETSGFLPIIRATQSQSSLAYLTVVAPSGEVLGVVSVGDVVPPTLAVVSANPGAWRSERLFEVGTEARWVREFAAPVMSDGELKAQVRVGFFEPTLVGVLSGSSFHARIALVIFLMLPVAQLWLRREIRPLAQVATELHSEAEADESLHPPSPAQSQSIEALAERIREFSHSMEEKNKQIGRERIALLASSKVLAHQKGRAELLFESVPDAIVAFDPAGRVTAANQRAARLLRRAQNELIGSLVGDWSPDPAVTDLVMRHSGSGERILRTESVDYSPDDSSERRHRASVHSAADENLSILLIQDVSEEESSRKTQAEFLAHMAHELKAPLNVMSLYNESLLERDARDDQVRIDACNVIHDEIDRLNGLINNIFSISRIEGGAMTLDRQRVRLSEMLSDLLEAASRDGDTLGLEFSKEIPGDLGPVFVDKALFSIAVKNLLSNATKYNRPSGTVSLHVEQAESGLAIRVRDTGHGIAEEEIGSIFDKFYRSEDEATQKVSGHGLGLALVKEIIALHGGEIQVKSQIGEGSEFTLFFDRSAAIFQEGL